MQQSETQIQLTSIGCGTFHYLPPECLGSQGVMMISPKVDIWSVGIIFYILLFGKKPFTQDAGGMKAFKEKMIDRRYILNFPEGRNISENSRKLIELFLRFDPEDRPDPSEALKAFYQNTNQSNS